MRLQVASTEMNFDKDQLDEKAKESARKLEFTKTKAEKIQTVCFFLKKFDRGRRCAAGDPVVRKWDVLVSVKFAVQPGTQPDANFGKLSIEPHHHSTRISTRCALSSVFSS